MRLSTLRLCLAFMHPPFLSLCACVCAWCCRQYEQDSHEQLVKTIEGQDLLPQVSGRLPHAGCWLLLAAVVVWVTSGSPTCFRQPGNCFF